MKHLLFAIAFFPITLFAQDDYKINVCKDLMTDKMYAFGNKNLVCLSSDEKQGFAVNVTFTYDKKSETVSYSGLNVKSVGIGNCFEKDELFFLFEDGTKVSYKSWNDFNCKGNSFFDLYSKNFDDFNSKQLKAIRFVNGRSNDSYTHMITKPNEKDYFINAKKALDLKQFINSDCKE